MTREEFSERFRPLVMGLLIDAYTCTDAGAVKFKKIERDGRHVEHMLGQMFDATLPAPVPDKPAIDPKGEWANFLSFEPPMHKVNERMPLYAKLPEPPKADVRVIIFEHAERRGWAWNKEKSAFETKSNGKVDGAKGIG
jgi:hypothetical protein